MKELIMGKFFINLNDIMASLEDEHIANYEVEQFINKFFQIGFECKADDVFNQNKSLYFELNFEFDQFKGININKIYKHYKNFIKNNELYDDILFFIAENYFNEYKKFQQEHNTYFNIVKRTFIKKPNYSQLIKLVRDQIRRLSGFKETLDQYINDIEYYNRDLSEVFEKNYLNNKNDYNSSIYSQIQDLQNLMFSFVKRDDRRLQEFFDLILSKYYNLEDDLLSLTDPNRIRDTRRSSREDMLEMSMSYSLERQSNEENIDIQKMLEKIKNEKNNIDTFDKLSDKIDEIFNFRINQDLLINFISSKRIHEHVKDIEDLKVNFGSILKD